MIFYIKKNTFCDVTKYEDFSTDEMVTPIKKLLLEYLPLPPTPHQKKKKKLADRDARWWQTSQGIASGVVGC